MDSSMAPAPPRPRDHSGVYEELRSRGIRPAIPTILAALKRCGSSRDVLSGKRIHTEVCSSGDDANVCVANSLVAMYSKCGSMVEARRVFDAIKHHDVVSWNTIILGYAENGDGGEALELFSRMEQADGVAPNRVTYLAAIKACARLGDRAAALKIGREIHSRAGKIGLISDVFVASTLVDMYSKCRSMIDARAVFEGMPKRDVVTWNSMILGFAESGDGDSALEVFSRMMSEDRSCVPDVVTIIALLKACSDLAAKETGLRVEASKMVKLRCLEKVLAINAFAARACSRISSSVTNTLIGAYAACGSLIDVDRVFSRMIKPTLVSWNAIILAYAENGEGKIGLELFARMQSEGFVPNRVTFLAALKACSNSATKEAGTLLEAGRKKMKVRCLEQAMAIHAQATRNCCDLDHFLANSLIFVYSQCGSVADSQRVFDKIRKRDVASWSSLIQSYAENDEGQVALDIFSRMQNQGWIPDRVSYLAALKACSSVVSRAESRKVDGKATKAWTLERVKGLHSRAAGDGFDQDIFVASSLVDLYSKCGSVEYARRAFDRIKNRNLVLWNALILGYAENGEGESALELFQLMQDEDRISPDDRSYVAALKACAIAATRNEATKPDFLSRGREIHSRVTSSDLGLESELFVGSSLVDMYVKCGSLEQARRVFDKMKMRDTVSWTAMIMGYQENGESAIALDLYSRMLVEDPHSVPDAVTFVAVLKACGTLGALATGREIHEQIRRLRLEIDTILGNCLVDFYGKCGSMIEAEEVFASLRGRRDGLSWNAMIAGYSHQGDAEKVFEAVERMREEKFEPDAVTFLSVLTACSHAGLVDRGREFFEMMEKRDDLRPGVEHYSCLVDLLGRANRIEEAVAVVRSMPMEANARIWMAVLAACVQWKNAEFAKVAFASVVRIDESKSAAYVLMSNIYEQ